MDIDKIEDTLNTLDLTNLGLDVIPDYVLENKHLRHLKITEGNKIKVSERYKVIDALNMLLTIDNQDLSSVRNGIYNLNLIFRRRLQEMFLTKAASEIYCEECDESIRVAKMVDLAKKTIHAGPESLKEFKDYKLEKLIRENYDVFVSDALELKLEKEENEEKENRIYSTSRKKRGATPSTRHSLRKSQKGSTASPLSISSPQSTPTSHKPRIRKRSQRFRLKHLLQTHSKDNDRTDLKTKVWMCAFEPDINEPGKTTSLVATCGGDSVCFIDCESGEVLKKYKQEGEEFYCLCWTVLRIRNERRDNTEKKVTVLAVAGVTGDIKLIEPDRLVCFERVSYHKKPVDSLQFHPIVQHWLFSGSEDRTIVLWDLGYPFSMDNRLAEKKLILKGGSHATVRQIVLLPHGKTVLAACDDGLYCWDIDNISNEEKTRSSTYHFQLPGKVSPALDFADSLGKHLLAVKRIQEGLIHLIYSKSEFVEDDLRSVHCLLWRKTETPFLKFNYCRCSETLLAGDDQGTVWMYNLHDLQKKLVQPDGGGPSKTKCQEKIRAENMYAQLFNHVTCSSSLKHVVAVSDCNVVAIWNAVTSP